MDFVAASSAAVGANIIVHPLETIKTRQVLQGGTTISLIQGIVKNEGVSGMYKGISPALLRAVISGGGRLAGYNFLKNRAIKMGALNPSGAATASEIPLRGVLAISAAVTAQLIAAPLDLIRTRQSMSAETSPSMQRVVKEILASHGVRGLFAGTTALLGRTVTFNFGQLLTYDAARSRAARALGRSENSIQVHTAASLASGLVATTLSSPAEAVKTHMQAGKKAGKTAMTMSSTAKLMWKEGGVKIFFRGWTPLYAKIAPHTLAMFLIMEQARMILGVATH
mmetsp:Transcript_9250/g.14666  ORF Transcript_9250/g.14666 Transcript_9250/m.14666 type:complete len:282 (+) Transcript_9250:52-897(+)